MERNGKGGGVSFSRWVLNSRSILFSSSSSSSSSFPFLFEIESDFRADASTLVFQASPSQCGGVNCTQEKCRRLCLKIRKRGRRGREDEAVVGGGGGREELEELEKMDG